MAGCTVIERDDAFANLNRWSEPLNHYTHMADPKSGHPKVSAKAQEILRSLPRFNHSDIKLLEDEALHDAAAYRADRVWHLEQ